MSVSPRSSPVSPARAKAAAGFAPPLARSAEDGALKTPRAVSPALSPADFAGKFGGRSSTCCYRFEDFMSLIGVGVDSSSLCQKRSTLDWFVFVSPICISS